MRVDNKHLSKLVEPRASRRGARHATLAITLTAGLDPDNAVHVRVISLGGGRLTESGRANIAPLSPVIAGTRESNTALVNDEAGGKTLSLKRWGEIGDIVALVVGLAAIGDGIRRGRLKRVVVGDVGGKAANGGAAASLSNNTREL